MDIYSPCIHVCVLIEDTCVGCRRTIDEIAQWGGLSDQEKTEIIDRIQPYECAGNGTKQEHDTD